MRATHNAHTPGNWLEHIAITVMGSASLHRVRVEGELDVATAGILRDVLAKARGRDVVVDVSGLSFIDALGVSTLILGYRDATHGGRSFVVQGARGTVRRVLELAEVDRLFAHGVAVG